MSKFYRAVYLLFFLLSCYGLSPAFADETLAAPPGLLAAAAKRMASPSTKPGKVAGATKFTPTAKPIILDKIVNALADDAEKRATLRTALVAGRKRFDDVATKGGYKNDLAFGLTAFVACQWAAATGGEVSDAASEALMAQTTALLSTTEVKTTPNIEKQKFYEYCVYMALFTATMYDTNKADAQTMAGLKSFAARILQAMLGVDATRIQISAKGLFRSDKPGSATTTKPEKATSKSELTYTLPSEWKADGAALIRGSRFDGDDTTYGIVILPRVSKQKSLAESFLAVWKEIVEPRFDTKGRRPLPLPYRLPTGVTVFFEGGYMPMKPGGEPRHVFLYLIDAGTDVIPLLGVENFGLSGLRTGEEKNVEAFFKSIRIRGGAPEAEKPFFTDGAALVGTWKIGSSSSLDFVTPSGAPAGTRVTLASNTFTLKADGTYDQTLLVMIAGDARPPGKITGKWTFKDGILTMSPVEVSGSIDGKQTRQKVLTVGVAPNGKTVLVFDGTISLLSEERSGLPVYEKQTP